MKRMHASGAGKATDALYSALVVSTLKCISIRVFREAAALHAILLSIIEADWRQCRFAVTLRLWSHLASSCQVMTASKPNGDVDLSEDPFTGCEVKVGACFVLLFALGHRCPMVHAVTGWTL